MTTATRVTAGDVLRHVAAHPGVLAVTVCVARRADKRRVAALVAELETAGLLTRPRRPDGTRPLRLTAAGEQHLATLTPEEL